MQIYQYMRLHYRYITNEITDEYNITDKYCDSNGYVYLEIRKYMYGLKEAAILVYEQLQANLAQFGYIPMKHAPGLWRHESRPKTFAVAVDNVGIKYFKKSDAEHLFDELSKKYFLTIDWTGTSYLVLTIN